jgi:hypothetical protein
VFCGRVANLQFPLMRAVHLTVSRTCASIGLYTYKNTHKQQNYQTIWGECSKVLTVFTTALNNIVLENGKICPFVCDGGHFVYRSLNDFPALKWIFVKPSINIKPLDAMLPSHSMIPQFSNLYI